MLERQAFERKRVLGAARCFGRPDGSLGNSASRKGVLGAVDARRAVFAWEMRKDFTAVGNAPPVYEVDVALAVAVLG